MKLLLCLLALMLPSTALAQTGPGWGGDIGVYPDEYASHCLVLDRTPGVQTLHVVHLTTGSNGSRFRIEFSPGFTGTLLSIEAMIGSMSGDPNAGLIVNYGECMAQIVDVLQMQVMMYGTGPECAWVRIAPYPGSADGMIDTYGCDSQRAPAQWKGTHIQHELFSYCPDSTTEEVHTLPACQPYSPPLAVDSATWGAVKALYR